MSRLLITRPLEDARPLAVRLAAMGHELLMEPMLEIVERDGPPPDLAGVQGLLFTSANGVRAFSRRVVRRDLPVFAVGQATAAMATAAGFSVVDSAGGDVEALAALVVGRCDPHGGTLFHGAASVVAGDLAGILFRRGYTVRREVLYEARPTAALSEPTRGALVDGRVDAVLLFSPRTARALVALVAEAGVVAACGAVDAVCLSVAVAQAAEGGGDGARLWRSVRIAERPDQEALLAMVAR